MTALARPPSMVLQKSQVFLRVAKTLVSRSRRLLSISILES
jgi:hypothetical protein